MDKMGIPEDALEQAKRIAAMLNGLVVLQKLGEPLELGELQKIDEPTPIGYIFPDGVPATDSVGIPEIVSTGTSSSDESNIARATRHATRNERLAKALRLRANKQDWMSLYKIIKCVRDEFKTDLYKFATRTEIDLFNWTANAGAIHGMSGTEALID